MSDTIQEIKNYIKTPEGAEWFMNAVKDAQDHMQSSEGNNYVIDIKPEIPLVKKGGNGKPLMVSRREMENVNSYTEKHPDPDKNGRYVLKVLSVGNRHVLRPSLLMRGEKVSNSQLISEDPKKILSGEISRVTTRGTHTETYEIFLTD
ncbi:MAG: hypothetical protein GXY48_09820 [Methanomicrobiales archaeon]|nr:hypothetical protein [Methanomicrobiales archaeon]